MERGDDKDLNNTKKKKNTSFSCRLFSLRNAGGGEQKNKEEKGMKRNKRNNTRKSHPSIPCHPTPGRDTGEKWRRVKRRERAKEAGMGWGKPERGRMRGVKRPSRAQRRQKAVLERNEKQGSKPREQQRKWLWQMETDRREKLGRRRSHRERRFPA